VTTQRKTKQGELSDLQVKAAHLLFEGKASKDVSKEIGIHPSTLSGWKHDPTFEAYMNRLRLEAFEGTRDAAKSLSSEAVQTVASLLREGETDAIRLRAADMIFALARVSAPEKERLWIGATSPNEIRSEKMMSAIEDPLFNGLAGFGGNL
jgi:hypothetical protein